MNIIFYTFILLAYIQTSFASFEEIFEKATRHDVKAQQEIYEIYQSGKGIFSDPLEAFEYFLSQGFSKALVKSEKSNFSRVVLGWLIQDGFGNKECPITAKHLFQHTARQGYASAQYSLADLYENNQADHINKGQAIRWYSKAAIQGYSKAIMKLEEIALIGKGHSNDYPDVYHYKERALLRFDSFTYNPSKQQTLELLVAIAEEGNTFAHYQFMKLFSEALEFSEGETALEWLKKIAKDGNQWASFLQELIYYNGTLIVKKLVDSKLKYQTTAQCHDPILVGKPGLPLIFSLNNKRSVENDKSDNASFKRIQH